MARAGTIAEAFDWNLALFGFPFPSELDTSAAITEWLSASTSIGDEGEYLVRLSEAGRFLIFPFPRKGFPPQLGELIIATRKPWPDRITNLDYIVNKIISGESLLVLFGLGPKGLPSSLFEGAKHHFDVTKRGKSLETCTAVGAVVGAISAALEYHRKPRD